jgi:hypothetical protein
MKIYLLSFVLIYFLSFFHFALQNKKETKTSAIKLFPSQPKLTPQSANLISYTRHINRLLQTSITRLVFCEHLLVAIEKLSSEYSFMNEGNNKNDNNENENENKNKNINEITFSLPTSPDLSPHNSLLFHLHEVSQELTHLKPHTLMSAAIPLLREWKRNNLLSQEMIEEMNLDITELTSEDKTTDVCHSSKQQTYGEEREYSEKTICAESGQNEQTDAVLIYEASTFRPKLTTKSSDYTITHNLFAQAALAVAMRRSACEEISVGSEEMDGEVVVNDDNDEDDDEREMKDEVIREKEKVTLKTNRNSSELPTDYMSELHSVLKVRRPAWANSTH